MNLPKVACLSGWNNFKAAIVITGAFGVVIYGGSEIRTLDQRIKRSHASSRPASYGPSKTY